MYFIIINYTKKKTVQQMKQLKKNQGMKGSEEICAFVVPIN